MAQEVLIGSDTTNLIFGAGYLFATLGSELANGQPFGKLQEISFNDALDFQKFFAPGARTALAAGAGQRVVSGSARYGALRPNGLRGLRGGVLSEAAGFTTWKSSLNDTPAAKFDLHCKTPSAGEDLQVKLFNCVAPSFDFAIADKGFSVANFAFDALGDSTNGVIQILFPGNMMVS